MPSRIECRSDHQRRCVTNAVERVLIPHDRDCARYGTEAPIPLCPGRGVAVGVAGDVHREGVVAAPWQRSHPCRRTTRTTIRIDLPTLRVTQHPSVYGHADEVVVGHCTTPSSGHCATRSRNPFWFPPRGPVMHVSPLGRGSRRQSRSSS